MGRPGLGRLLLDGAVNALRDLFGRPRPDLRRPGRCRLHYSVAGGAEATGPAAVRVRRWFRRFTPVLAVGRPRRVYSNDDEPLADKLYTAPRAALPADQHARPDRRRRLGLAAGVTGAALAGWDRLLGLCSDASRRPARRLPHVMPSPRGKRPTSPRSSYRRRSTGKAASASSRTRRVKDSHIHVLWPKSLPDKNAVVHQGLWHVCPAHVYEARAQSAGPAPGRRQLRELHQVRDLLADQRYRRLGPRRPAPLHLSGAHAGGRRRLLAAAARPAWLGPPLPHRVDIWEPADRRARQAVPRRAACLQQRPGCRRRRRAARACSTSSNASWWRSRSRWPRSRAPSIGAGRVPGDAGPLCPAAGGRDRRRACAAAPWPAMAQAAVTSAQQSIGGAGTTLGQRNRGAGPPHLGSALQSWAAADGRHIRSHHVAGMRRMLQRDQQVCRRLTVVAAERAPRSACQPRTSRRRCRSKTGRPDLLARLERPCRRRLAQPGTPGATEPTSRMPCCATCWPRCRRSIRPTWPHAASADPQDAAGGARSARSVAGLPGRLRICGPATWHAWLPARRPWHVPAQRWAAATSGPVSRRGCRADRRDRLDRARRCSCRLAAPAALLLLIGNHLAVLPLDADTPHRACTSSRWPRWACAARAWRASGSKACTLPEECHVRSITTASSGLGAC